MTRRRGLGLLLALLILLAAVALSIAIGARTLAPADVWHGLWHPSSDGRAAEIVQQLRLPRTALGLVVGAALGVAGALMQALTRNPLADPGLLGVNAGAAAAVVIAMATLGVTAPAGYVWFAFAGAAVVALLVHGLGGGSADPARVVLAGLAVTAALQAFIAGMVVLEPQTFEQFRYWEVGAIGGRGWPIVWQMGAFVGAGLVLALVLARSLNALALGEDAARALGTRPRVIRALGFAAVTVLTGAATAAAGPIAFVGLAIPHVARAFTGPDQRWILPLCLLLGPALLLVADTIGRVIDPPSEVQAAVVTAFLGAPLFIMLVSRRRIAQL